ncbi:glycosyltransferase family 4 protein [Lichenihabitans psoromatis]|uniref:glycosyltransferase family 4 protein n=1 Tax=Lichenihabitans psoromatis TaxID=2528642 RepID=UPI0010382ED5|nr:glycosyltransferase family 1 protein [Lichenihabitans psoromatis]
MRIVIATDAWHPQVNGVVRSIEAMAKAARPLGAEVEFLTPEGFASVSMPTYPDIQLAFATSPAVARRMADLKPDHIHIATEGPIGLATRHYCRRAGLVFTTSYHTQFPDYIAARAPIPKRLTFAALRWFHNGSAGTMVSTGSIERELTANGFRNLMRWSRGVDHDMFKPRAMSVLDLPRPIFLSVGRVAVEKNVEAFLSLDLPGSKVVVGDGPAREDLQARFPDVTFLGMQTGETLAAIYASADVFVFPSRTDTFGIVLLEALASGLPVAAYPVPGPNDVIGDSDVGVLDENLELACRKALTVARDKARAFALRFTWTESARQFLNNVMLARSASPQPLAQRISDVA